MPEPVLVWREHTYSAKWALSCTGRLGTHTLMAVEVCVLKHRVALVARLVFVSTLTLFDQVFVQWKNLNHLLTFPASSQDRALFPIVNVNWFFVEIFVIVTAKVARLVVHLLPIPLFDVLIVLVDWLYTTLLRSWNPLGFLLIGLRSSRPLSFAFNNIFLCTFGSTRIYIRLYNRFLMLLGRCLDLVVASINFSQLLFDWVNLGLS